MDEQTLAIQCGRYNSCFSEPQGGCGQLSLGQRWVETLLKTGQSFACSHSFSGCSGQWAHGGCLRHKREVGSLDYFRNFSSKCGKKTFDGP